MNTITTSYAASKGNTPVFKGYVDKSVYRYAAKLENVLKKDAERMKSPYDQGLKVNEIIRRVFTVRSALTKLVEKAKKLDDNTFISITKERFRGDSLYDPVRTGTFLSIRNSKITGSSVGEFSLSTELQNRISPETSSLALGHFNNAVDAITNVRKPDLLIAINGASDIFTRKMDLQYSSFPFIKKLFLKIDEANLEKFEKAHNIQSLNTK